MFRGGRTIATRAAKVLSSAEDASVNFVIPFDRTPSVGRPPREAAAKSTLEARYVRRSASKVSAYVSSHGGCGMGCKFCWLTAQGQTSMRAARLEDYDTQLATVLGHYADGVASGVHPGAYQLNVNFMARGEALANRTLVGAYPALYDLCLAHAAKHNFRVFKMNISTIMPLAFRGNSLADTVGRRPARLFYSLYSLDERFRRAWMPGAMPPLEALAELKRYQEATGSPITFHWAFIEGVNDSREVVADIAAALREFEFVGRFNLVRFNPPPGSGLREPNVATTHALFGALLGSVRETANGGLSRVVPRVGRDVHASCGMFVRD